MRQYFLLWLTWMSHAKKEHTAFNTLLLIILTMEFSHVIENHQNETEFRNWVTFGLGVLCAYFRSSDVLSTWLSFGLACLFYMWVYVCVRGASIVNSKTVQICLRSFFSMFNFKKFTLTYCSQCMAYVEIATAIDCFEIVILISRRHHSRCCTRCNSLRMDGLFCFFHSANKKTSEKKEKRHEKNVYNNMIRCLFRAVTLCILEAFIKLFTFSAFKMSV